MAVRMVLPPGFRFHPTDEELVAFYLKRKASGLELHSNVIPEVDLYKLDPWDLPNLSCISSSDSEAWYFFHNSDRKYMRGSRFNRATPSGYWKATGRDRRVMANSNSKTLIGTKKILVFYRGRAPNGERTNWVMHEFHLAESSDAVVVCRVLKRAKTKSPSDPVEFTSDPTDSGQTAPTVSGSASSGHDTPHDDSCVMQHHNTSMHKMPTISLYASSAMEACNNREAYNQHIEATVSLHDDDGDAGECVKLRSEATPDNDGAASAGSNPVTLDIHESDDAIANHSCEVVEDESAEHWYDDNDVDDVNDEGTVQMYHFL